MGGFGEYSGGFVSQGATFFTAKTWDPVWGGFWDGWAYSNMTDTTTKGYQNQYSAITGRGVNGSSNYGVAYDAGGVTTSTVTVPLVAALGVGLASIIKGRNPLVDGFGLIAFASLLPMIFVMGYGLLIF